jgi:UDP-N-acetylglucosamine 2-epimerase (non-hydrolysing)
VSLHRYENVFNRESLASLVETIEELARDRRMLFILHPPTERQMGKLDLRARLDANPNVELRPRYTYFDFVTLLEGASFVVTDGGSIQEESSYLGLPCLLMRRVTERPEGLGDNVLLSNFDADRVRDFALNPEAYRREPMSSQHRPSQVIVDAALRWA